MGALGGRVAVVARLLERVFVRWCAAGLKVRVGGLHRGPPIRVRTILRYRAPYVLWEVSA